MPSTSGDANAQNTCPVRMPVGRSLHNRHLEARAVQRLTELTREAERANLFGTVAVEVVFERGRIVRVRRRSDGTDKR